MKNISLTPRLDLAASFVRQGSTLYDIGTDHGYLPIALLQKGTALRAVVSDLNEAPLESAKQNFLHYGLSDKAEFIHAGGVAVSSFDCEAPDVAICGMGGELIADIIEEAPILKDPKVRMILQPMTHIDRLRRYLWKKGFEIIGEGHAAEGDKCYAVLSVKYTGESVTYTEVEALLGKHPTAQFAEKQSAVFYKKIMATQNKILSGKKNAGKASKEDEELVALLKEEVAERIKLL